MTDYYNSIIAIINEGYYVKEIIAMLIFALYMPGDITSTEMTTLLNSISWTYNSTNYTLSDGTNTYTVYQLLTDAITQVYKKYIWASKPLFTAIISKSETGGYITNDELTTLEAEL
jgi:hypothetical protein